MKSKVFAFSLSLTLLLAPNLFVYSQTANNSVRSTDELVALLVDPEAVVVVNVKKMLTETAPTLLNNDVALMGKLSSTLRLVQDETGVDPFSLDKIAFGLKLDKSFEDALVVIQSRDSAAALAENIFQNRLANAKLADEINPLKNRIAFLEGATGAIKDKVIPQNQAVGTDIVFFEEFQGKLAQVKPTKAEQIAYNKLKTDSDKLLELLKDYESLLATVYSLGDLPDRLTAVKSEANKVSVTDTSRIVKIAAGEKKLAQIETEFMARRNRMMATDDARMFGDFAGETFSSVPDNFAAANAADRRAALTAMQKSVDERLENLASANETMKSTTLPIIKRMEESDAEDRKNAAFPTSTVITRKEETVGGKKMFVVTIDKKFPANSLTETAPFADTLLILDDRTLLMGERETVVKSLESKSATRSQNARNMIAKSPDALVAFGVDLRSIDLTEFAKAFGEQKTALQVFGALSSTGNDLSLSATVEKTDIPVSFALKSDASGVSKSSDAMATDNAEIDDLLALLTKSIVGIEGKLTVRFEKKKALALLAESPQLLSGMLNGKRRAATAK